VSQKWNWEWEREEMGLSKTFAVIAITVYNEKPLNVTTYQWVRVRV